MGEGERRESDRRKQGKLCVGLEKEREERGEGADREAERERERRENIPGAKQDDQKGILVLADKSSE